MLVPVDVLECLPGGGWRLIEVKSTTRLKEVFSLDVAVQLWVLPVASTATTRPSPRGSDPRSSGVSRIDALVHE